VPLLCSVCEAHQSQPHQARRAQGGAQATETGGLIPLRCPGWGQPERHRCVSTARPDMLAAFAQPGFSTWCSDDCGRYSCASYCVVSAFDMGPPPPSPCNYLWLLLEAQSPRHSLGSPVAQAVVRPTRSSSRHSGCSVALQLGQCSRPVNLTAVAPRQARSTLTYGSWGCAWPSVTTVCCTRASSRTGQTSLSPGGVLAVHHLPPHHSLPTTYLSTTRCPPTHQV
jgi:hypothetical protein